MSAGSISSRKNCTRIAIADHFAAIHTEGNRGIGTQRDCRVARRPNLPAVYGDSVTRFYCAGRCNCLARALNCAAVNRQTAVATLEVNCLCVERADRLEQASLCLTAVVNRQIAVFFDIERTIIGGVLPGRCVRLNQKSAYRLLPQSFPHCRHTILLPCDHLLP